MISTEARAKYNEAIRNDEHAATTGSPSGRPTSNFSRPALGPRQETYGEDPYLTGRIAVAFIKGCRATNPHYSR